MSRSRTAAPFRSEGAVAGAQAHGSRAAGASRRRPTGMAFFAMAEETCAEVELRRPWLRLHPFLQVLDEGVRLAFV